MILYEIFVKNLLKNQTSYLFARGSIHTHTISRAAASKLQNFIREPKRKLSIEKLWRNQRRRVGQSAKSLYLSRVYGPSKDTSLSP